MAVPSNTLQTYAAVGNREDMVDKIYMVEQTKTPFTARIPKVNATATFHEWNKVNLAAAVDTNAVIEGDDATTDAANINVRLGNYTQISDKVAQVAGTQEVVDKAGKTSEMSKQIAYKMMELKRDIEKSALANKARNAGGAGAARVAAGVESWVVTNSSGGTGAVAATGNGTDARTPGTARAFTEDLLKAQLAACADQGGDPNLILLGSFNKQAMSAFTGNGITRNVEANAQALNTAIDIYVSDFGTLEVVYSPFSNAASCLVVDTELWAMATLRAFERNPLAKTGDSTREQIITEWTIESRDEQGNAAVYDLTVA